MGFNTFPCNPYPISTEELNKGNNDDLNTRVAALESDVYDLNSNKANQITIAPFFNAETAYTAGDLVYYNGLTYRCTNDHEGAWDADDFAETTIAGELDTLKNGLIGLNSIIKTVNKQPDPATEDNIKRDILSIMSDVHAPYCVNVRYSETDAMLVGARMGINYASVIVLAIGSISYYKYYGGAWTVTPIA